MKRRCHVWTDSQVMRLRELSAKLSRLEIAHEMRIPYSSIVFKIHQLGIQCKSTKGRTVGSWQDLPPEEVARRCEQVRAERGDRQ